MSESQNRIVVDGKDYGAVGAEDVLASRDATDAAIAAEDLRSGSVSAACASAAADESGGLADLVDRLSLFGSAPASPSRGDAGSTAATSVAWAGLNSSTTRVAVPDNADERTARLGALLQLFCDTAVDATLIISSQGQILTLNRRALEVFGYERWELVGRNVKMLMEPKYSRVHDLFIARYMRTRMRRIIGEERDRLLGLRKDGSLFRMLLKVHEYRDERQTVFIGVVRDVSYANVAEDFEALLHKFVPRDVSDRLVAGERVIADSFRATVGFIDVCGYTRRANKLTAAHIVLLLAEVFAVFDNALEEFDCMRVKTIGDGYMFTTKLTNKVTANAVNGTLFAHHCVTQLAERSESIIKKLMLKDQAPLCARAGVATGTIISGVVPGDRFAFDVWGTPVNLASRLESSVAAPNEAVVDECTFRESNYCIDFAAPVSCDLKGFDESMETYRVRGLRQRPRAVAKKAHFAAAGT